MSEDQTESDKSQQVKSVLDNLADNFRDWTTTATEKAGEFTRVAAEKAEELGKLGKLKMDIYQLQRERQKALSALGLIAFTALKGKPAADWDKSEEISELIARVKTLDNEIAAKEERTSSDMAQTVKADPAKNGKEMKITARPKKKTTKKTKATTTEKK
ncbi:hypothetical protein ACFL6E_02255 [Candidatus Neomarinimicrobiota bacterium]